MLTRILSGDLPRSRALTVLLLLVGYLAGQPMVAEAGKMFGLVTLAYILIVVVLLGAVLGITAGASLLL